MPTKYVHLDADRAIHLVHGGATTLPHLPPALRQGAPIVFLHGEGGSAQLWSRQIAHFSAAHSPIALDLPGHGRSTGLDGPASIDAAAEVVGAVLAAIGCPPAVLVGHGLGGQVALATAALRADRVRGVVTIGTALRPDLVDGAIEQIEQVVRGRIGQQFDTPFFGPQPDMGVMREFWGELVKTDPRVRLSDLVAYRDSAIAGALGRVGVPVLVVHGDGDRLCCRERGDELVGALRNARLVSVEGAGHVAHLERAEVVNRAIEDFVAAL